MKNFSNLKVVNDKIIKMKKILIEIEAHAKQFPALSRNSQRALATIKMLELNVSDIVAFGLIDS